MIKKIFECVIFYINKYGILLGIKMIFSRLFGYNSDNENKKNRYFLNEYYTIDYSKRLCLRTNFNKVKIVVSYSLNNRYQNNSLYNIESILNMDINIAKQNRISGFLLDAMEVDDIMAKRIENIDKSFGISLFFENIEELAVNEEICWKIFNCNNYIKIDEKPVVVINHCDKPVYDEIDRLFHGELFIISDRNDVLRHGSYENKIENETVIAKNVGRGMIKNSISNGSRKYIEKGLYFSQPEMPYYFRNIWVSLFSSLKGKIYIPKEQLKKWIMDVCIEYSLVDACKDSFIILNSWEDLINAEGTSGDDSCGYLDVVKQALNEYDKQLDTNYIVNRVTYNKQNKIDTNFYIHCIESLGDIVAAEPIARKLLQLEPSAKVFWIVRKDYSRILQFNPYIDNVICVSHLGESVRYIERIKKDEKNIIVDCHFNHRYSDKTYIRNENLVNPQVNGKTYLYYGNLLTSFCLAAGMAPFDDAPRFYLDENTNLKDELPSKYIVFHCHSADARKDWSDEKWSLLAKILIDKGYKILEIGLVASVNLKGAGYYNFTHERDIQKIAYIIKNASCFVGIDSGFAHIANCFDVHGVILMGKFQNYIHPYVYSGNYNSNDGASIIYASNGNTTYSIDISDVENAICSYMEQK